MEKILVALSGGVDSSVAAALLVEQGYDVCGVTMRLWSEPGCEQENQCCTPETRQIAQEVANKLNIPFTILDAADLFRQKVVQSFLDGYLQGGTPNPCIVCNRYLKWGYLRTYAQTIGATHIATGHYARVKRSEDGRYEIWKGLDPAKDQSYVLCLLSQDQVSQAMFPCGEYTKPQVREIARKMGLPAADAPESQDLCFLGGHDYRDFLRKYVPQAVQPGPMIDRQGKVLGEHQGLAFYTIGQRKGLPASTQALYVLEKRIVENVLVIGTVDELGMQELRTKQVNWISGEAPKEPFQAEIKIRFKAVQASACITPQADGSIQAVFTQPLRDITAGQMAVIYNGDQMLGGGEIV